MMKIDIQGHELDVLAADPAVLADGRIKALIVGTHGSALFTGVCELLSTDYDIIHRNPAPDYQPDGLIVARHRTCAPMRDPGTEGIDA